jgi:DNA mismatch repair protein MutS2
MGVPGGSNAFEIALRLGIPESIIKRARSLLSEDEIKVETIIKELNQERNRYQNLRQEMESYHQREKELKEKYERLIVEQQEKHQTEMEQARKEAAEIVQEAKKEARRIISELKDKDYLQRSEVDRAQSSANQDLKDLRQSFDQPTAQQAEQEIKSDFEVGDQVRVRSIGRKGEIIEIDWDKKEARIQAGIMKITASLTELVKVELPEPEEEEQLQKYRVKKATKVANKLDLRGERYEAAQYKVDKYLDDAFLAGLKEIEIVHGKGTGALREAVEAVLQRNEHVEKFRLGIQREGGTGVTIVRLK